MRERERERVVGEEEGDEDAPERGPFDADAGERLEDTRSAVRNRRSHEPRLRLQLRQPRESERTAGQQARYSLLQGMRMGKGMNEALIGAIEWKRERPAERRRVKGNRDGGECG